MNGNSIFLAIGSFLLGIVCFSILFAIIEIIARIKIFEKMDTPIWKAIIPFYGDYALSEQIWDSRYIVLSWIMLGVSLVTAGMSGIKYIGIIFRLITFILPLGVTVIRFRMYMWLAKAFNKSTGFAVGLFFLPIIFEMILGFDKSKYQGNTFLDSDDDF